MFEPIGLKPNGLGYKHDKQAIIEIGTELFRKRGYHQVGINEILEAGGIPKGSFYHFFEGKEDFARQTLLHYGETSLERIRHYLRNAELSPLERLKSFYRWMIDANVRDGLDAGCLVNNMSIELAGMNREIARQSDEQFMRWVEEIARCVMEGQEKGEITNRFSSRKIAEFLHAGSYGAFARMKATRSKQYLEDWYVMSFAFIQNTGA